MRIHYILSLLLWSGLVCLSNSQNALLWQDGFLGNLNTNAWSYDTGNGGNGQLQEYTRSSVQQEGGNLVITVEEDKTFWDFIFGGRIFTSGRVTTKNKLEVLYGLIEARIKVSDPANGLWPALWMLGTDVDTVGWPESGSMTVMQMGSAEALRLGESRTRVGSALHWARDGGSAAYDSDSIDIQTDLTSGFHTYAMNWTPERITTFVDGEVILTKDITPGACAECDEFHRPYFLILSVAVGGSFTGIRNEDDVTASFPAEMVVDSIRIFDNGFTQLGGSGFVPLPTAPPVPTEPPTVVPSSSPSLQPSVATTSAPSLTPTDSPTKSPTSTQNPTTAPTSAVSLLPLQNARVEGVVMTLTDVKPLDKKATLKWAKVTRKHLENTISTSIGESSVVKVNITIVSQNPSPLVVKNSKGVRRLQTEDNLEIAFNADYAIQSPTQVQDVKPFVVQAFAIDEQRAVYLDNLKQSGGESFANVSNVSVDLDKRTTDASSADANNQAGRIGLIVGLATAVVAVSILGLFLYCRKRNNPITTPSTGSLSKSSVPDNQHKRKSLEQSTYATTAVDESVFASHVTNKVAPNDTQDHNTASSSLAPLSYQGDEMESNDGFSSGLSSLDVDYNYRHAYWTADNSILNDDEQTPNSITTEEQTVCDEFTINAPSGKLGLVLQTSDQDGCPVVFEIKPSSPLKGSVKVGDRLHSVDGRDVTLCMSETVARIIASKEACENRVFVFGRPQQENT